MKKYLIFIAALIFSCTTEIESPESILERFFNASINEESSSSYEDDGGGSGYEGNTSSSISNRSSSSGRLSSSSRVSSSSRLSSSSIVLTSGNCPVSTTGPVSYYGKLKASGKNIVGSKTGSTPVQVRGVSLFWSNTGWGGDRFFTETAVNAMVDCWKAEVIRVPMGHGITGKEGNPGSYLRDKDGNMARVKTAIDAAIARNVYVIIDWHSHSAHLDVPSATEFFTAMAQEYGGKDHVIFEIYNEPVCNGGENEWDCPNSRWTTWADIKTYATSIISTIRAKGADNLILVGTPYYSASPSSAIGSFLSDNNVGYVFHFYAETHKTNGAAPPNWSSTYSAGVTSVLNAGKPVFVSEYGTTNADGGGGANYDSHDATSSDAWHTFMDNNKISSCAWSLNDKHEGSSFFGVGAMGTFNMSSWDNASAMTASGQYIYNKLRAYANSAPWRSGSGSGGGTSSDSGSGGGGGGLVCDYGPVTIWGGGCFEIEDESDCDLDWGTVKSSCP